MKGLGVNKNVEHGVKCYKFSAKRNNKLAMLLYAKYHLENGYTYRAKTWLKILVNTYCYKRAYHLLGLVYEDMEKDEKAINIYAQGYALRIKSCMRALARFYMKNDNTKPSAIGIYKELVNMKCVEAVKRLAMIYETGNGIDKNEEESKRLTALIKNHKTSEITSSITAPCNICQTNNFSFVFWPCGHTACETCCNKLDEYSVYVYTPCHICREDIIDRYRVFY
jgi:TPR repeat protein